MRRTESFSKRNFFLHIRHSVDPLGPALEDKLRYMQESLNPLLLILLFKKSLHLIMNTGVIQSGGEKEGIVTIKYSGCGNIGCVKNLRKLGTACPN